ncbi:T9SS type A sorting domain-containing protein [Aquimarina sp. RZ0]|uniref:NHL domain-containing protein n=1 Tax=Aquimarina sp. RZ0 TaxID=2607730 RepID=UPI0011F226D7|nr:T9SS type A sorting domain-containing protein [Aquimarina sp. RZ0]KAA1245335.1 T9SS type A sorting domain-containing protein [Aquimarina sp. RZ0]
MTSKITLNFLLVICSIVYSPFIGFAQYGNVSTFAGTGVQDFSGDDGPAINAELNFPGGIAVDAAGNVYFSEITNPDIRKVDINGIITTFAGSPGSFGSSGDGGLAVDASLNSPQGLAFDIFDNLYIADRDNNKIRKVNASDGIISTIAGLGTSGFSGDNGQATLAELDSPQYVAVDVNGNVYISDWLNNRIRKVDATTGIITTIAGTGDSGFSGDGGPATSAELRSPSGIAVDTSGNIFFADRGNNRIRRIDASGVITTVAGSDRFGDFDGDGGLAINAKLDSPNGIITDAVGNIFIADRTNQRIRRVNSSDGLINTIAGTGATGFNGGGFNGDGMSGTDTRLNNPSAVAISNPGDIYIADGGNHRVRLLPAIPLSIEDVTLEKVQIFNTPTNIKVVSKNNISTIEIFDLSGKNVLRKSVQSLTFDIDISGLQNGVYLINLEGNDIFETFKFLK